MNNIKTRIFFLVIPVCILLYGCSSRGLNVLYKTKEKISMQVIGCTEIDVKGGRYSMITALYQDTVAALFKENGFDDIVYCDMEIDFERPDIDEIKNIISDKKLDGLIISNIRFPNIQSALIYSNLFTQAVEVGLKLFDKDGKLKLSLIYKTTQGNVYYINPSQEKVEVDGMKGAIKGMCNKLNSLR